MKPHRDNATHSLDDETLQVQVPATTKRAIHIRSAETGDPMRVLVLKALAAYGFPVPDQALVDRRKQQ
jgi:hypothetical protein